jgi:RNA polymerase sigma-70 factor (ECF subfamily)
MTESEWMAEAFEKNRTRLRAVAYRMLGSLAEADDVVQEAWLRLSRSDTSGVDNLGAWLTTVVARVCLNALRSRNARREEPMGLHMPDPVISRMDRTNPEDEALLADSVGLALQVVLETLAPAERLAFVLHDMFDLPFDQIAPIVDRSPAATRQLASRARRRLHASAPIPDPDLDMQWKAAEAFYVASRNGDFNALLEVLDPDVVLRTDFGAVPPGPSVVRGAEAVASQATAWGRVDLVMQRVRVNGTPGVVLTIGGQLFRVGAVTVKGGKIVEIDFLGDPERLAEIDLAFLDQ